MDHVYGMLKSSNSSTMPYGNNFVVGPSLKSRKEPIFCTAKRILKYCRLYFGGSVTPEKIVGLTLVPIIEKEPRFKDGIVRRWELPLRSKSNDLNHVKTRDQKNCDVVLPITNSSSLLNLELEDKCDKIPELLPAVQDDETTSLPLIVVNDIKSFALLDAKFREEEERNRSQGIYDPLTEEFIQDIRPTYSGATVEKCIINEQEHDNKEQTVASGSNSEIVKGLIQNNNSTEVLMYPRPSSAQKSDTITDEGNAIEKKPMLSSLKLIKRTEMFKREKEKGWRIKESYDIYSAKRTNRSQTLCTRQPHCGTDVSRAKSVGLNHPQVKPSPSVWLIPDVRNVGTEKKERLNRDAERRIKESFRIFVERQNQGRIRRALKEQESI